MPPSLGVPDGWDIPLPRVAERKRESHQSGRAWIMSGGNSVLATSSPPCGRSWMATDMLAAPAFACHQWGTHPRQQPRVCSQASSHRKRTLGVGSATAVQTWLDQTV